jgi:hypothetical protein
LTSFLLARGVDIVEVNQPHPQLRARRGKDDAIDAEAAAMKALSGQATVVPKNTTGVVESAQAGVPWAGVVSRLVCHVEDVVSHRAMVSENCLGISRKDTNARWLLISLPSSG